MRFILLPRRIGLKICIGVQNVNGSLRSDFCTRINTFRSVGSKRQSCLPLPLNIKSNINQLPFERDLETVTLHWIRTAADYRGNPMCEWCARFQLPDWRSRQNDRLSVGKQRFPQFPDFGISRAPLVCDFSCCDRRHR